MLARRLVALALLAWALVVTVAKRLLGRAPTGLAAFERNYRPDGLLPLAAEDRALLPGLSRCIACGRCNEGDGGRMRESRGAYPGTMQLVLASARSMPDFGLARRALAWVSQEDLVRKERLCPTKVPIGQVSTLLTREAVDDV